MNLVARREFAKTTERLRKELVSSDYSSAAAMAIVAMPLFWSRSMAQEPAFTARTGDQRG